MSRAPAFARVWLTHEISKPLGAGAECRVVAARRREGEVSIRATDAVGIIVAVVLPETDRADVVRTALGKGAVTTTWTQEPPFPRSACSTHPVMIAAMNGSAPRSRERFCRCWRTVVVWSSAGWQRPAVDKAPRLEEDAHGSFVWRGR